MWYRREKKEEACTMAQRMKRKLDNFWLRPQGRNQDGDEELEAVIT